jgi:eukaryotic-like serine/threonine-protein kinase
MPPPGRRSVEQDLAEGMRLLDRYSILDRIGSGGMATIYRATDDRLDRVVCVKLLRTTLVEGSGSTSGRAVYEATYSHFLKEALALSKLQHPNTLRIYDFGYLGGTDKGAPFHVSEYLDGGNLETHVRLRGPIPGEEALGILDAVSGAVAEAHEHGIIHRDIKPSNILFARIRGELVPKLADFGIAHSDLKKKDRDDLGESVSTVALFSPRWAAPEQLCGSPEGPRTDVYALGLLIVFMLSGGVLFGDEDVRLTFNDRVRGDTLVSARLAQLGFSGDLRNVLMQSMVARPEDRIATAPELYEKLRDALRVRASQSVAPFPVEPRPAQPPPVQPAMHAAPPAFHGHAHPSGAAAPLPPPPAPPPRGALALEVDGAGANQERIVMEGARRIRYVQVHEKLDLAFVDNEGGQVRVRITMLPSPTGSSTLNIKGLTCFVSKKGGRPTPATSVSQDGSLELVSTGRQVLGEITWSFGGEDPRGRVFLVDGRQLLVPYSEAQQAVAVMLSHGSDLVVMCRR